MGKTQSAGNRGEAAVARYLRQKGYTLLESQWRCRFGELDLVAKQAGDPLHRGGQASGERFHRPAP